MIIKKQQQQHIIPKSRKCDMTKHKVENMKAKTKYQTRGGRVVEESRWC